MLKLKFDRVCECDWCCEEKVVSITKYGSTNSNRLICEECAKDINEYEEMVFGKKVFELEESKDIYTIFVYADLYGDKLVATFEFDSEQEAIAKADELVTKYARVEILDKDYDKIY